MLVHFERKIKTDIIYTPNTLSDPGQPIRHNHQKRVPCARVVYQKRSKIFYLFRRAKCTATTTTTTTVLESPFLTTIGTGGWRCMCIPGQRSDPNTQFRVGFLSSGSPQKYYPPPIGGQHTSLFLSPLDAMAGTHRVFCLQ